MKVKVLPDAIVNKIAAGEVIERPSSLVRELVDNAVDAGASFIHIEVENGGKSLIKVTDDGSGMGKDDAILAFERHATSKIRSEEDIFAISSRGFRGEALPSIAAVARVRLLTRQREANENEPGVEVLIEGGILKGVKEVPARCGTSVEVRSLFFNTPARKKFLKSDRVEEGRIETLVERVALGIPHVAITLTINSEQYLCLPSHKSVIERAKALIEGNAVELCESVNQFHLEGLLLHPSEALHSSEALIVLVNGRPVSDRVILRAVREGFHNTLKEREYPRGVLNISIDPRLVDVNVHPQKSEVRFTDSQGLFATVQTIVQKAVGKFIMPVTRHESSSIPYAIFRPSFGEQRSVREEHTSGYTPHFQDAPGFQGSAALKPSSFTFQESTPSSFVQERVVTEPLVIEESQREEAIVPLFRYSDLIYRGTVLSCYLVAEKDETLYLIDFHAAHERINYNRIFTSLRARTLSSQKLLLPRVVKLERWSKEKILNHKELLGEWGIDVDEFGPEELVVRAVPTLLPEAQIESLIKELAVFPEEGNPQLLIETLLSYIAARLACHASKRSGDSLTREEVYALFRSLDDAELGSACPHGRPVIVKFSSMEVEKWFGRDR